LVLVRIVRIVAAAAAIAASVAAIASAVRHDKSAPTVVSSALPRPAALSTKPSTYLGVYAGHVPKSYSGVTAFMTATGVRPGLVACYGGWLEGFPEGFAATAAREGAVPLVQIQPTGVSLAAIANGRYDDYLSSYADAVRAYGRPVILSFGHEMNGSWYSWGYRHTSPATFVAAWRQIVTVFRSERVDNVTWLWTVNIINGTGHGKIPDPAPWWPGSAYVNWVGIDGYYFQASWKFAPLFGPTIAAVREVTGDPILISETAAAPTADQPAKVADLFGGVRSYGLLGFVWFDTIGSRNWRLTSAADDALREGARTYKGPRE
jgi:mannan endo-1,4-beta-mannosidase